MNTRWSTLVPAFLLGAVLAAGATWVGLSRGGGGAASGAIDRRGEAAGPGALSASDDASRSPGTAGDAVPADPRLEGSPEAGRRLEALRTQNAALEKKVQSLEQEVASLKPKPRDPKAFRFGLPPAEKTPAFDRADWKDLAAHMTRLSKTLIDLQKELSAGKDPSAQSIARIGEDNTPLAVFAVAFGGESGSGSPNAAYTHPAVIANLMRAALLAADDPLTPDQELALQTLGQAWVAEAARAQAALAPTAPKLAATVVDVDEKLRFLESAKGVLTTSQRSLLFPPETEGRLKLDLLSPALVYVLSVPVAAPTQADLATKLLTQLLGAAGVQRDDLSRYEWIGRQWVADLAPLLGPYASRSKDLMFPHVSQVQARARAEVAAIERVLGVGGLSPEESESLRQVTSLLYPYLTAGS